MVSTEAGWVHLVTGRRDELTLPRQAGFIWSRQVTNKKTKAIFELWTCIIIRFFLIILLTGIFNMPMAHGVAKGIEMARNNGGLLGGPRTAPPRQSGLLAASDQRDRMDVFKEYIKAKEGPPILKARKPTDSRDSWTVGHGHTSGVKEGMEITKEQADRFLQEDTAIRLAEIKKHIPNFDNFPLRVQVPLMYSLFRGSLGQSPETRKLINKGKFKEAAKEFLDNDEYRGAQKEGSKRRGIIENDFHALRDALLSISNGQ